MIKSFFHYTSRDAVCGIARGDYGPPALRPIKRFIGLENKGLPEKAYTGAIFGVLERAPPSWDGITFNKGDSPILSSDFLIEAFIEPEDEVYIADYSIFKHKAPNASPDDLYKAYFESLKPVGLEEHWQHYSIKEVVCFSPIPVERLQLTELRPKPPGADIFSVLSP